MIIVNKFTKLFTAMLFIPALLIGSFLNVFSIQPAFAENALTREACANADEQEKAALGCNQSKQAPEVIQILINVVISIVGIIAIGMIVVAGQRYIVSNGDPGKIQAARNMIIYSLIGLVIAVLAFAIVNFVLGGIFSSGGTN